MDCVDVRPPEDLHSLTGFKECGTSTSFHTQGSHAEYEPDVSHIQSEFDTSTTRMIGPVRLSSKGICVSLKTAEIKWLTLEQDKVNGFSKPID